MAPGETGVGYLFATRPGSVSFEPEPGLRDPHGVEVKNGVFSHFLLSGLACAAESNDDGVISFTELSDHVGSSLQRLADAHRETATYDQVPYSRYDGPAGSDIPILVAPKPTPAANDRARDPGQGSDNPTPVSAPALVKSSPDAKATIESGSRVNLVLEFDQEVASVSVGRVRLALDSSRRIATGTFDVPTGVATYELAWLALGVNRLEARGSLNWSVTMTRVTPLEALSRCRSWSGEISAHGKRLGNMTVTFEPKKGGISSSPVSFDFISGKYVLTGEFNGQSLGFELRTTNSKNFLQIFGTKVNGVKAPADLSDDGRTITGKLMVDTNVIGEYTLRAR